MFGLPLYSEFIQGSAIRTWNCVASIANFIWYKFASRNRDQNMPRSRRRHHSRSRSRSRSHSHDKDRDAKRRKIESFDSPHHRRSMSSEPEVSEISKTTDQIIDLIDDTNDEKQSDDFKRPADSLDAVDKETDSESDTDSKTDLDSSIASDMNTSIQSIKASELNPSKALSPKQMKKRLETEKRRMERQKMREEREKKKQEERDEKKRAKEKIRQEKDDQKKMELEQKMLSKKEKVEKDELKRKEKEQERAKKQQEIDEKNREKQKLEEQKQKLEEQKQKAAAAFVKFFVPKKETRSETQEEKKSKFMPFEVKSDMRVAPMVRRTLTNAAKEELVKNISSQDAEKLYLDDLKDGREIRKSWRTWCDESSDDVIILDDLGESIMEPKLERMKAKYFKFTENQRPAYFGTWRKKSKLISAKNPLRMDKELLNYEVDSDEEWEEIVDGESIAGSDNEDKENESENENDYEVDNEFFVEHAYLSDGEGCEDDEVDKVAPDVMKAKMKLIRKQFDEERNSKTKKIKPRLIGCVWYDADKKVDDAIDKFLRPLSIICQQDTVVIKKRSEFINKKERKGLDAELVPELLRLVHGNPHKGNVIAKEYVEFLKAKNIMVSTAQVKNNLKQVAEWIKIPNEKNKMSWFVKEDAVKKYDVELKLPNTWEYLTK